MPDLPVLLAFTVAGFILFATPGPDMSLWLAKTVAGGRRAGLAAMAGTSLGCAVHTVLAALGISVLIRASPVAFNTMKIVGAVYLLFLAVQTIRRGTVLRVDETGAPPRQLPLVPVFLTGLMVNLTNPKVVIFFITFLPGFVSAADPHAPAKLFFLGFYFIAVNFVLAAILIAGAARFLAVLRRNPGVLRVIDWLFAGVFGVFAVTILRTQAR
ncbi:MAG: LysE family translocator [Rhodobacteraceae bacterium]|nr:LysE family translocator [Paracoccaceae bacterium]